MQEREQVLLYLFIDFHFWFISLTTVVLQYYERTRIGLLIVICLFSYIAGFLHSFTFTVVDINSLLSPI